MRWEVVMPLFAELAAKPCNCACTCGSCNCAQTSSFSGQIMRQGGIAGGNAGHDNIVKSALDTLLAR